MMQNVKLQKNIVGKHERFKKALGASKWDGIHKETDSYAISSKIRMHLTGLHMEIKYY